MGGKSQWKCGSAFFGGFKLPSANVQGLVPAAGPATTIATGEDRSVELEVVYAMEHSGPEGLAPRSVTQAWSVPLAYKGQQGTAVREGKCYHIPENQTIVAKLVGIENGHMNSTYLERLTGKQEPLQLDLALRQARGIIEGGDSHISYLMSLISLYLSTCIGISTSAAPIVPRELSTGAGELIGAWDELNQLSSHCVAVPLGMGRLQMAILALAAKGPGIVKCHSTVIETSSLFTPVGPFRKRSSIRYTGWDRSKPT